MGAYEHAASSITPHLTTAPMENSPLNSLPELENVEYIGAGNRVHAYRARWKGRDVIVKRYKRAAEQRCQKIQSESLARFEHRRNSQFYALDALRPYCAEPLACLPLPDSEYADEHVFVQEYLDGQSLCLYVETLGYLPTELFEAGRFIVEEAERNTMHDLDVSIGNIRVIDKGERRPMLYDFNLIPQYIAPRNPFLYLCYKFGFRQPSHP